MTDSKVYPVTAQIGPIARPNIIQWAPGLPKTRSGGIMRNIAANELDSLDDTRVPWPSRPLWMS